MHSTAPTNLHSVSPTLGGLTVRRLTLCGLQKSRTF